MDNTNKTCPNCGCSLNDNLSSFVCMKCGHSITPEKKFDTVDVQKIGEKDANVTNVFFSLGALWWILLILGGIISSVVSLVLLFDLL